jgi:hypothetical protein
VGENTDGKCNHLTGDRIRDQTAGDGKIKQLPYNHAKEDNATFKQIEV